MADHETEQRRIAALGECRRWADLTIWQHERMLDDLRAVMEQHHDHEQRRAAGEPIEYGDAYVEPWTRLAGDQRFFVLSARHLLAGIDMLNAAVRGAVDDLPSDMARHVTVLRDCVEHWDERIPEWHPNPSRRAGLAYRNLQDLVGHQDLGAMDFNADFTEITIGGLAVHELIEHVERLRRRFAEIEHSPSWIYRTELPAE